MKRYSDGMIGAAALGMILLLIIPLSPFFLDILLILNILLSVMALFLALMITDPLEFSTFPSFLLFLTLFRLGLNIASTRMILSKGEAGKIIATFGEFVIEGSLFIGFIIFILITLINFVVITKGATRIAEVAARFALEALPGKQLGIDSEVAQGALSGPESKKQRSKVQQTADFYGAMDGASKFVRGDAWASLIILMVNLVGGFFMGITSGNSLSDCLETYTHLTIGDGVVNQLPALLISLTGALMVSRASEGALSSLLLTQLTQYPKVIFMGGLTLLLFSLLPGMPHLLFLMISLPLLFLPWLLKKREQKNEEPPRLIEIELLLGLDLLKQGEKLLQECAKVRMVLKEKLGFLIPPITIKDELSLPGSFFCLKIKGKKVVQEEAERVSSIIEHVSTKILQNASLLLKRNDVILLTEEVKSIEPNLIDELIPKKITISQLHQLLQNLLKEGCPIHDLITILEVASCHDLSDLEVVAEQIRQKFARQIVENFLGGESTLHTITLDPKVEQMLSASLKKGTSIGVRPITLEKIEKELSGLMTKGKKTALLTTPMIRRALQKLLSGHLKDLQFLCYEDVQEFDLEQIGSVSHEVLI